MIQQQCPAQYSLVQRWPWMTSSQWQNPSVPGPLSGDGRECDTPGAGNTTPARTLSPCHSPRFPQSHDVRDPLGFPGEKPGGSAVSVGSGTASTPPSPQGSPWHSGLKFHMHFSSLPLLQELLDSRDCPQSQSPHPMMLLHFSHPVVSDSFVTPGTVAHQAPPSMGFPRQECWSGLPFPSPGIFLIQGMNPPLLHLAGEFFTAEPPGKLHPIISAANTLNEEEALWFV